MYKKVLKLFDKRFKLFFLHAKHKLFKYFIIKTPKIFLTNLNIIQTKREQKIPKIIYQTWHSPEKKLSKSARDDLFILKKLNPEYEHKYFLDNEIETFVHENFPGEISECFNKLNLIVCKVDLWRYLILLKNGGIYLDIDSRTNTSFSKLIKKEDDAIITFEHNQGSNIFAQWVLIFNKNHPALKKVVEVVIDNIKYDKYPNNVLEMTGPKAFSRGLKLYFMEEYGLNLEEIKFNKKTNIIFSKNLFQTSFIGENFKPFMGHKPPGWESLYKEKKGWKKILTSENLLK